MPQWGEAGPEQGEDRSRFLYAPPTRTEAVGKMQQATLKPMRGTDLMINRMVTELTNSAMDLAELTAGVDWSEWCGQEEQESIRSKKEELWLWKRLDECDRIEAKKEKVNPWKKSQKIEKARQRMGAGKSQPGIMSSFLKRAENTSRQI